MRRLMALATLLLLLPVVGCGTPKDSPPAARPDSSDTPPPSPTRSPASTPTKTSTTTASAGARTATPPTSNPKDCFDGDCTLELSKPVAIRLDTKVFYYPEMTVVAVGSDRLTYRVDYPHGGGAQQTLSPGGSSAFGFRSHTRVEVKLVSITKGTALLSLAPGKGA